MAQDAIAIAKRANEEMTPEQERSAREAMIGKTGMGIACHPFPNGAWSIEAKTFRATEYGSASADLFVVVYVGDRRVEISEPTAAGAAGMFISVGTALASDYDKDGVPEFWMHVEEEGVEGGHMEQGSLLRFDGKDVVPYGPASKLGLLSMPPYDVDGDGLIDLPTSLDIRLGEGIECGGKENWSAAKLLAHALPDGTFSTNDAVAKSFVSSWCASAPSKIASPEQALCARMWKLPRTIVSSTCAPWDCVAEANGKPQKKNATRDCQDRLEAYDAAVPFTLP